MAVDPVSEKFVLESTYKLSKITYLTCALIGLIVGCDGLYHLLFFPVSPLWTSDAFLAAFFGLTFAIAGGSGFYVKTRRRLIIFPAKIRRIVQVLFIVWAALFFYLVIEALYP